MHYFSSPRFVLPIFSPSIYFISGQSRGKSKWWCFTCHSFRPFRPTIKRFSYIWSATRNSKSASALQSDVFSFPDLQQISLFFFQLNRTTSFTISSTSSNNSNKYWTYWKGKKNATNRHLLSRRIRGTTILFSIGSPLFDWFNWCCSSDDWIELIGREEIHTEIVRQSEIDEFAYSPWPTLAFYIDHT